MSIVRDMRAPKFLPFLRYYSGKAPTPRVCIVGSGPTGFYATQQLLKLSSDVQVDIIERLPVPYGLVRFGVAPDHPEVKNVIHTFDKIAKNPRVHFFGNINVGRDVTLNELKENYHAILLAYGAEEDRVLGIPGETLKNVISGRRFVGWYNGLPSDKDLKINLDVEEVAILGQGNVAIDIARILLSPIDKLKNTDITSYSLDQLSRSKIKRVKLIGRRGPLQAAFTIAELREMIKLEGCQMQWRLDDFKAVREIVPKLVRPRKRLTELMLKNVDETQNMSNNQQKIFAPIFFRGPKAILGSVSVEKIELTVNELVGDDFLTQNAKSTSDIEEIPCGLLLRSIGYKSVQIDDTIPFDERRGRVRNSSGKVDDRVYAAGWVATGPTGVILSTMTNAFQVGNLIHEQLEVNEEKAGSERISRLLKNKNIQIVSYEDWEKIDKVECERGEKVGKVREKIVDVSEMLRIASS